MRRHIKSLSIAYSFNPDEDILLDILLFIPVAIYETMSQMLKGPTTSPIVDK